MVKKSKAQESKISVAVRVRPLIPKERTRGDSSCINVQENMIIVSKNLKLTLRRSKGSQTW